MKTRLLAYGCSNTFGEGLDDIWRPGNGSVRYGINLGEPSRFAWPRELGRLMKFDRVHNLAEGGASNKKIWRNILQTEIDPIKDTVVVQWTFVDRYTIFYDDGSHERFLGNDIDNKGGKLRMSAGLALQKIKEDKNNRTKVWYEDYHTDHDAILDSYCRISHTKYYLDSKGIRNFHFINDKRWNWSTAPSWIDPNVCKCLLFKKEHGVALDGMHPGKKSQKKYAHTIYDSIIDQSK